MLSYNGDESLKNFVVSEIKKLDIKTNLMNVGKLLWKIIDYFDDYRDREASVYALAIFINIINKIPGNSYEFFEYLAFEKSLGIPAWLVRFQDLFFHEGSGFESLDLFVYKGFSASECSQFAIEFFSAIPVGVNLSPVQWKFRAFLLKECIDNVLSACQFTDNLKEKTVNVIISVLNINELAINTGVLDLKAAGIAQDAAQTVHKEIANDLMIINEIIEKEKWSLKDREANYEIIRSSAKAKLAMQKAVEVAIWLSNNKIKTREPVRSEILATALSAVYAGKAEKNVAYKKYANELIRLLKSSE